MPQPQPLTSPLSDKDRIAINEQLANLQRLRTDIEKAHAAGVDCTERSQYCDFLQGQLQSLKQTYFPNKP